MTSLAITLCSRRLPVQQGQPSALVATLETMGHRVREATDGPLELADTDVVWISGNANWFPRVCDLLVRTPARDGPCVLIAHGEPLPLPRAAGFPRPRLHLREVVKIMLRDARATDVYSNYWRLRWLARHGLPDLLVVPSTGWLEFLAERGMTAHWVPFGYDPSQGRTLSLARDLEVLFLGALDVPRRRRVIRRLRRAGVNLVTMGSWSDPECWGENRTRLLNRTNILLNLARQPGELAGQRLLLGMANRALVISEPIYRPAPFVPGTHYVSATIEEMPEAIAYYLAHPQQRADIVDAAYRFVTEEVTSRRSLTQIVALIEAQRAHAKFAGALRTPIALQANGGTT